MEVSFNSKLDEEGGTQLGHFGVRIGEGIEHFLAELGQDIEVSGAEFSDETCFSGVVILCHNLHDWREVSRVDRTQSVRGSKYF